MSHQSRRKSRERPGCHESRGNVHMEKVAMKWKTLSEITVSKGRKRGAVSVLLHAVPPTWKATNEQSEVWGAGGSYAVTVITLNSRECGGYMTNGNDSRGTEGRCKNMGETGHVP